MLLTSITALAISVAMALVVRPVSLHAADRPMLLKRTVNITTWRFTSYWKNRNGSEPEWDTWSWVPRISFQVLGPVAAGSQFSVEYTMPDGKPWLEVDLATDEVAEGELSSLGEPSTSRDLLEKEATLATGVFGYKIMVKNELAGTNDVLMSGKFKVDKFHKGLAQFKNQFEYYVDQDWRMPIGWVWLDPHTDERTPYLKVAMWLRGDWRNGDIAGYLLKDGKTIASTKEQYGGAEPTVELQTMADDKEDPKWSQWEFEWRGVMGFNHGNENIDNSSIYYLDKNPGDYEVKVLYGGKLVRAAKFTIDADGTIVDNGIATRNNVGGVRQIIPVTIVGDNDGKWDRNAWKTDAFYGNPLVGFVAP
jgi:hypothetical protein